MKLKLDENLDVRLAPLVAESGHDERTGKLTEGIVNRILAKSPHHPHGIKVMLETGVVGRVKEIVTNSPP